MQQSVYFDTLDAMVANAFDESSDRDLCISAKSWQTNNAITLNYIEARPSIKWDYSILHFNPNVTLAFVLKHLDEKWNFYLLSTRLRLRMSDVLEQTCIPWNFSGLSMNPGITFQDVLAHIDKPWNFTLMSSNPSIRMADVRSRLDLDWSFPDLSSNPTLTIDDLLALPNENWYSEYISAHKNITIKNIIENPQIVWHPLYVCTNPNVTIHDIETVDYPWNYYTLSRHKNIPISYIVAHPDKPWSFATASENPNLRISDVIERRIDKKTGEVFNFWKQGYHWDYHHLSANSGISMSDINENPEVLWNSWIVQNPNVSMFELIHSRHLNRRTIYAYSALHSCKRVLPQRLIHLMERQATRTIQRAYRKQCFCNPHKALCRARLEREFYASDIPQINTIKQNKTVQNKEYSS